jgi:hypothetical protein
MTYSVLPYRSLGKACSKDNLSRRITDAKTQLRTVDAMLLAALPEIDPETTSNEYFVTARSLRLKLNTLDKQLQEQAVLIDHTKALKAMLAVLLIVVVVNGALAFVDLLTLTKDRPKDDKSMSYSTAWSGWLLAALMLMSQYFLMRRQTASNSAHYFERLIDQYQKAVYVLEDDISKQDVGVIKVARAERQADAAVDNLQRFFVQSFSQKREALLENELRNIPIIQEGLRQFTGDAQGLLIALDTLKIRCSEQLLQPGTVEIFDELNEILIEGCDKIFELFDELIAQIPLNFNEENLYERVTSAFLQNSRAHEEKLLQIQQILQSDPVLLSVEGAGIIEAGEASFLRNIATPFKDLFNGINNPLVSLILARLSHNAQLHAVLTRDGYVLSNKSSVLTRLPLNVYQAIQNNGQEVREPMLQAGS